MSKRIILLGTLDTKGPEFNFARQLIEDRGHTPVTIDCGIMGTPFFEPTISRQKVAAAAETTIEDILGKADKNYAIHTMTVGSTTIVEELYREGQLDGILALGGGQGTIIGTTVMQALPFGVPKVVVSAVANGQTAFGPFVGTRDITIIHSVADVLGLNMVTRQVIAEGVGAVSGMVEMDKVDQQADRPTIGMTTAGVTTACAMHTRDILESRGYEVIAFHCNGIGAKAMEELADAGRMDGILDISPKDIPDLLFGGIFPASDTRMEPTCRRGIPQVVVPGTTDFILYPGVELVPPEILERKHVIHNPLHTHVRANYEEMFKVGEFIAERLAQSKGPADVLIPNRGFTQLNIEGGPMYDPEADRGFLAGLQEALKHSESTNVKIEEFDLHINDKAFAKKLAERIDALVKGSRVQGSGI
jgi:uncharacterized protein (UPF0261 family)